MASIIILSKQSAEVQEEITLREGRLKIGRLVDNDLRLDDTAASGHHAIVHTLKNDSFIQDLDSTNGTFVNGKKIRNHALENNDVISIGNTSMRFRSGPADTHNDVPKAWLELEGPKQGELRTIALKKTMTTLGTPGEQLIAITLRGNAYYLTQIDAENDDDRALLNGNILGTDAVCLSDGDAVNVGKAKLTFRVAETD